MSETTERLDAITARLDAATPGPWFQHQDWIDMGVPDASHTISSDPKPYGKFIASVGLQYDVKHGNANLVAHAPEDVAYLLALARKQAAALERVESLAKAWESRGEHDMKFSKSIPNEDIAMAILTEGASKVENARHIRNALEATL